MEKSWARRTRASYSALSPCGWYLPITSPTIAAHLRYELVDDRPISPIANRMRRWTGLRPSRTSGRARDTITLMA